MKEKNMNELPAVVARFLEASNRQEVDEMIACFGEDAVVLDVGESLEMKGLPAIRGWLEGARSKYRLHTNPLEVKAKAEAVEILAEVSGTFDGSPLRFRYDFRMGGGLIKFLSTTFVGK